ncbi:MAG: response regulator [Magnetococcales bacterium]|nr:response regulator [Magnetococcales bacterium]
MAHVLVIDDDQAIRNLVRTLLNRDGHKVIQASGGIEGLQVFLAKSRSFDLVITDISMPDLNGEQVVQALLQDDPTLNILVFSGSGFESDSGAGLSSIQNRYPTISVMEKPFTAKEFRGEVALILLNQNLTSAEGCP